MKQLTRSSPFSFGTISPPHGSNVQDFCNDNVVGTFDTFETVGQKSSRTTKTHAIMLTRCKSTRNAGLLNPGNLCYSNVIYQAFASCKHFTTFLDDPPCQKHDNILLCYEFTMLLNSMMNNKIVVDTNRLTDLFQQHYPHFVNVQGEYYISIPIRLMND